MRESDRSHHLAARPSELRRRHPDLLSRLEQSTVRPQRPGPDSARVARLEQLVARFARGSPSTSPNSYAEGPALPGPNTEAGGRMDSVVVWQSARARRNECGLRYRAGADCIG